MAHNGRKLGIETRDRATGSFMEYNFHNLNKFQVMKFLKTSSNVDKKEVHFNMAPRYVLRWTSLLVFHVCAPFKQCSMWLDRLIPTGKSAFITTFSSSAINKAKIY